MMLVSTIAVVCASGCATMHPPAAEGPPPAPPITVVVAPVLNLSNSADWDILKVTDWIASEMQQFQGLTVIPVNRAAAALAQKGKVSIESADDAIHLARELGAEATIVTAITEYSPYDPPTVGIIMQWYSAATPELQVQRVYNAAIGRTVHELKEFARKREGHESPYEWRVHTKSQELFVRYCCWATIRSMLSERTNGPGWTDTSCETVR